MSRQTSLTQYLVEQQREHGHIPAQLRLLIEVVARACKRIAINVNKGELGDVLGSAGSENVQGEVQKKLDIIANETLIEANEWGGALAAMTSNTRGVANRVPTGSLLWLPRPGVAGPPFDPVTPSRLRCACARCPGCGSTASAAGSR